MKYRKNLKDLLIATATPLHRRMLLNFSAETRLGHVKK